MGLGSRGIRAICVAKTDEQGVWRMMGLITFLDPPRPDTKDTVAKCKHYGTAVKMITGDHLLIALETSRLREMGYRVGMTGDGVNDSPALKRADVGIAVFGATDAAKAASDIVLTTPGLSTIVEAMLISRRIWCRVRSFLTYRIAATLQLICFFFIAVFAYRPNEYMPKDWEHDPEFMDTHEWPPFFHMPVLMLMLITLLNDGTLITIGYDYAVAPETPPIW